MAGGEENNNGESTPVRISKLFQSALSSPLRWFGSGGNDEKNGPPSTTTTVNGHRRGRKRGRNELIDEEETENNEKTIDENKQTSKLKLNQSSTADSPISALPQRFTKKNKSSSSSSSNNNNSNTSNNNNNNNNNTESPLRQFLFSPFSKLWPGNGKTGNQGTTKRGKRLVFTEESFNEGKETEGDEDSESDDEEFIPEDDEEEVDEEEEESEQDEFEVEPEFDPYLSIAEIPPKMPPPPGKEIKYLLPKKEENDDRPTVVLDLDETLVHCSLEEIPYCDKTLEITSNGVKYTVYACIRPKVKEFLSALSRLFEVVLFTASQKVYANAIVKELDPQNKIKFQLYREDCVLVEGNYLKDLALLGRDMNRTVIVDNLPLAFAYQIDNGIPIESYYGDSDDNELMKILPFLQKLGRSKDVRPLIRKKFRVYDKVVAAMYDNGMIDDDEKNDLESRRKKKRRIEK